MDIGMVVQSTHPMDQEGAAILRQNGDISGSPHSPSIGLQLYHITQQSRHMFLFSQLSKSSNITLRYNMVDWYSATPNVVHFRSRGPRPSFRSSRAHRSLTALHKETYEAIISNKQFQKGCRLASLGIAKIKERVKRKQVQRIYWVDTTHQQADILMKRGVVSEPIVRTLNNGSFQTRDRDWIEICL